MKDIDDLALLLGTVLAVIGFGIGIFHSTLSGAALESREREAIERGFATYVDGEFAWKEKP